VCLETVRGGRHANSGRGIGECFRKVDVAVVLTVVVGRGGGPGDYEGPGENVFLGWMRFDEGDGGFLDRRIVALEADDAGLSGHRGRSRGE